MSGRHKWSDIRRSGGPESETRVNAMKQEMLREMSLAELRRARELTQLRLAETLDVQQSAISRLEKQSDLYLSTLRGYVEAMGGQLEIKAVFPDAEIPINVFRDLDPNPPDSASPTR